MKLATFESPTRERRIGAITDDLQWLVDLAEAQRLLAREPSPYFSDMLSLIEGGKVSLSLARQVVEDAPRGALRQLTTVQLLAPLPEPTQMRDFLAFEAHLKNSLAQLERLTGEKQEIPAVWYERPVYYKGNRLSVVGPDVDVRWPTYAQVLDYELELACVIGTRGTDIRRDEAAVHIFGFTIFNDVTVRDAQLPEIAGQLGPGKSKDFDTGNVLGPWIVTADEIGDPYGLTMVARVNGEEWSRGSSGSMYHKFEDIIAFLSQSETLYPGEVLGSGTVGTGSGVELGRFPQPGDVIELEIERIGTLRNRFVK